MKIFKTQLQKLNYLTQYSNKGLNCYNLRPLPYDSVSFGKMKKNEFEGIDLLVVNKFKAPIEKFNNNRDLQIWCKDKIKELQARDLKGRNEQTITKREETFKEWCDYVLNEDNAYTKTMALLIIDGILKDIKHNNDKEIPQLNKRILADTIEKMIKTPECINFNKEYNHALQNTSLNNLEKKLDCNKTGWVVIPSKKNDPDNFQKNVDYLRTLSCASWCTSSLKAEPYLSEGDFHIYLDKGVPKLGVRFNNDLVMEIQGVRNDEKIPIKYLDIASEHTKKYYLYRYTKNEFKTAKKIKKEIDVIRAQLNKQGVDFNTCSSRQLLKALDIPHKVDDDGLIIVEEYGRIKDSFSFDDIGVNENKLLRDIKEIKGNADFTESNATDIGALECIGGDANFCATNFKTLGKIKNIKGHANFSFSKIEDLGSLESIGGNATFRTSKMTGLNLLQSIGGDANFYNSEISDIGSLKNIGGDLVISRSKLNRKDFKTVKVKGRITE